MSTKTFCKRCSGAGHISYLEEGWDQEPTICPDCKGKGEVEYHSKSEMKRIEELVYANQGGRAATGMADCGVPLAGHCCTCGATE